MSYNNFDYTLQAVLYCLYMMVLCVLQGVSVLKLIKYFSENEAEANKLSLMTIGFCTIYDAYLCLSNLFLALIITRQLQFFLFPAFSYFIVSTIFEMRLLVMVWRARYMGQFETSADMRRGIAVFYLKFYIALLSFLILMYYFSVYNMFSIWLAFFMLP
jgi:hypothetical protein